MTKTVVTLACAAALLMAYAEAHAAPAAKPETQSEEPAKPDENEAKPEPNAEEGPPTAEGPEGQPEGESGPVALGELTKDGVVIRTSNFIPAEAVTRQSGKVSSDALVVTLQKSTSTAVCFYTLKAYVGKKLNTIPACTVHR
jgi:hypothetical protein